jgi:hypothetical protein
MGDGCLVSELAGDCDGHLGNGGSVAGVDFCLLWH